MTAAPPPSVNFVYALGIDWLCFSDADISHKYPDGTEVSLVGDTLVMQCTAPAGTRPCAMRAALYFGAAPARDNCIEMHVCLGAPGRVQLPDGRSLWRCAAHSPFRLAPARRVLKEAVRRSRRGQPPWPFGGVVQEDGAVLYATLEFSADGWPCTQPPGVPLHAETWCTTSLASFERSEFVRHACARTPHAVVCSAQVLATDDAPVRDAFTRLSAIRCDRDRDQSEPSSPSSGGPRTAAAAAAAATTAVVHTNDGWRFTVPRAAIPASAAAIPRGRTRVDADAVRVAAVLWTLAVGVSPWDPNTAPELVEVAKQLRAQSLIEQLESACKRCHYLRCQGLRVAGLPPLPTPARHKVCV
jgi:hypothetical protein